MTLRYQLLAHKAQIKPITLMGETYYVKPMTVGEINHQVFEQRQTLIELAKADGVELPAEEGEAYDDALTKFAKKYGFARAMASRVCDEEGNLLFNADSLDDLKAITALDAQLITDFNNAMAAEAPKALVSEENSN